MPPLLRLSAELILQVSHYLGDKEISHLILANRYLSVLLSPILLDRALEDKPRVVMVSALGWAIERGHTQLVRTIVTQPHFSAVNVEDALKQAARLGNCEIIKILLDSGYSTESWASDQQPLHLAVMNGHAAATKVLLDAGAKINAKDHRQKTAFMLAILSPRYMYGTFRRDATKELTYQKEIELKSQIDQWAVQTLQVLVDNGAYGELAMTDISGGTPLHQAVTACLGCEHNLRVGTGVMQFLVSNGISPGARDHHKYRPIDIAVSESTSSATALNFFLELGASANSTDFSGRSLLANAMTCSGEGLPLMEVLFKWGARTDGIQLLELFDMIEYPGPVLFDRILTLLQLHGATFGNDASKCFTLAAIRGSLDTMKVIFATGNVDINTFAHGDDGEKGTPLQIAIKHARDDMLQFLFANDVHMTEEEQEQIEEMFGIED